MRRLVLSLVFISGVVVCPAAIANTLFYDDFSQGDSQWTEAGGIWDVVSGAYRGEDQTGDTAKSIAGNNSWTDYTYTGRFLVEQGTEATLLFRVQDTAAGKYNGHYYQISNYPQDDKVWIQHISNGNNPLLSADYILDYGVWYNFKIVLNGISVNYYINDTHILSYNNLVYSNGKIGVKTYRGGGASTAIALFDDIVVSSKASGYIVAWGDNREGQCNVPLPNNGFVAVATSNEHNLGLKADGSIVAWGNNYSGQCNVPLSNSGFVAVSAGAHHSLGLKADGSIVAWGGNEYGQLDIPVPNTGFVAISVYWDSLALRADGSIVGWGRNMFGEATPPAGNDFVAIAAGSQHSLAIRSNGSIIGWGYNAYGEVTPPAGNDFVAVAAGDGHSLALRADGSIVGWGRVGEAPSGNDFIAIDAGGGFCLALKANGSIVAWGENQFGQCNVPSPNNGFVAISAGGAHSLGLKAGEPPTPEIYMLLNQPLSAKTCWTEIKGGAGNIEQDLSVDNTEEPQPSSPIGNYLGTKSGEIVLTSSGAHAEIEGERVSGQTSKLGLGQPLDVDLISFIPILSTIADIADHWYREPVESDKRRRYTASVLEGSVHIGSNQPQTVKLAVNLEMKGAASGEAHYETQLLKAGFLKMVLLRVPTDKVASNIVERYALDNIVLGIGVEGALCLAFDSRFRAFSDVLLGLGEGSFYNIDDDPIGWSTINSSEFNLGVISTRLLPTYWGLSKWLPESDGTQNTVASSVIERPGVPQKTIEVESGTDIPLSVLLRTYAETAGFAAAEAKIDGFTITISAVDYPQTPPLVINSDPEWSFPTFSRVNPYFERSDLLAAASANDLTYGAVSIADSVAGVNTPDNSALVFVDCNSVSGIVVPVYLPQTKERHIKLKLDVLLSRPLDSNEHSEIEVGLTNQNQHEILWSFDSNAFSFTNTPVIENGFTLHTGVIELNLDVGHFDSGTAFFTLAGYSESNDCNMGFVAYGLSIDPKFVLGDFDLDADVDFTDFASFAQEWLITDCNEENLWCKGCDFDESGNVNINDLIAFTTNWLWSRHIPGDIDFSGSVNFVDFSVFANRWMTDCDSPDWCNGCDFDKSGKVDINDLGKFIKYWLLSKNLQ